MQACVFTNQGNRHSLKGMHLVHSQALPFLPDELTTVNKLLILRDRVGFKEFTKSTEESLLRQKDGDLICGRDVMYANNLVPFHLARIGDLLNSCLLQGCLAAACNDVRSETSTTDITDGPLCRLGLLLRANQRNIADLDLKEVVLANSSLELSHGLNEWCALDVSNSTAQFDDTDIRLPSRLIHRNLGDLLNPVLDFIRQMGDDLHSLSEVISTTLLGDDMVVDLAGGDIVVTAKSNAKIALIVSKIQICFCTVVANEHFTVF